MDSFAPNTIKVRSDLFVAFFTTLLGLLVSFFGSQAVVAPATNPSLPDAVKHFSENDDSSVFQELVRQPREAARLLIAELHPVEESRILGMEQDLPEHASAEHVLAMISGLRIITGGQDFCAATSHKFGDSEIESHRKYWTEFDYGSCLTFFGVWPSRGSQYIAPQDAQIKIIAQWKGWYKNLAPDYQFKPYRDLQPWVFGWHEGLPDRES